MKLLKIFITISILVLTNSAWACETLDNCMTEFTQVAGDGLGTTKVEGEFAVRLAKFGDDAVVELLPLLLSENEGYRNLASYTLLKITPINARHLDALNDGLQKDRGWLPSVIARIGTDKAKNYLVRDFIRKPESGGQMGFAFKLLGEKVTGDLINLYHCKSGCDRFFLSDLRNVFGNIKNFSQKDIQLIVEIAKNNSIQTKARHGVLEVLVGKDNLTSEKLDELVALKEIEPSFSKTVNQILIDNGSINSNELIVEFIKQDSRWDHYVSESYINLTKMGKDGAFALPALYEIAVKQESDYKLRAIRTIGFVGDKSSVPFLSNLLDEKVEWQVVYVAINALSQLNATSEFNKLKNLSENHWYKVIRDSAATVINRFETNGEYQSTFYLNKYAAQLPDKDHREGLESLYGNFWVPSLAVCDKNSFRVINESSDIKKYRDHKAPNSFKEFSYLSSILHDGYFPDEHRILPHSALKVDNGWLLGANRGEFGGELTFMNDKNEIEVLLNANVEDIFKMSFGYIAVTGLAHMSSDSGAIFLISKSDDGKWTTKKWLSLPGAARSSWFIKGEKLLINTTKASIAVTHSGNIQTVECSGS